MATVVACCGVEFEFERFVAVVCGESEEVKDDDDDDELGDDDLLLLPMLLPLLLLLPFVGGLCEAALLCAGCWP